LGIKKGVGVMKFLLLTDDEDYGKALIQSMNSFRSGLTVGLSSIGSKIPEGTEGWNLVIIDEPPSGEKEKALSDYFNCPVLFLTDKPWEGDQTGVYKYGSVKNLLKIAGVLIKLEGFADPFSREEGKPRVLVVTGARGGSGKTAISLGIGSELSIFHQSRVLYLNGGEFDLTEDWHPATLEERIPEPGLSRYLYYRESRESVSMENFYLETPRGVRYFYPTGRKNPLQQLTANEVEQLIMEIGKSGGVDWLIVELPNFCGDGPGQILRQADGILCVSDSPFGMGGNHNRKDREILEMIERVSSVPCGYIYNQRFQDDEWCLANPEKEQDKKDEKERTCFEIEFDPSLKMFEGVFDYRPEAGIFQRRMREITQWILDRQDWI